MILRGIDFGYVLTSAGARNFFGEGYWFHRLWPWSMMDFTGSTFVTKTITLNARPGNMPLCQDQLSPREFFPKCVKVYWRKGLVLNAVGLSGPGAKWLFAAGTWQKIESPFFISFMAVSAELKERREELWQFVELFSRELSKFKAKVGLEINFSCPNVGLKSEKLLDEVQEALTIAARLNIPLVPNFNPLVSPESTQAAMLFRWLTRFRGGNCRKELIGLGYLALMFRRWRNLAAAVCLAGRFCRLWPKLFLKPENWGSKNQPLPAAAYFQFKRLIN